MSTTYTQEERITKKEDIVRKVKACLARAAEGSGATVNEAAIAARQAEALMRKYNLENSDLIEQELLDPANVTWAFVRTNMFKHNKAFIKEIQDWPQWIAIPCAKLYDCEVQKRCLPEEGWILAFYGYKMDVDVCTWVFDYLLDLCRRESLRLTEADKLKAGETCRLSKYRSTFRQGMAAEIATRLDQVLAARQRELATGTALVVSKKAAIRAKFGQFGEPTKGPAKVDFGSDAFWQGKEAGKKVNLTPNPVEDKSGPAPARVDAPRKALR